MSKVIKHGNTITEKTCPKCFCIFEYTKKDIETHNTQIYEPEIDCFVGYKYLGITCPECGDFIVIDKK